MIKRFKQENFLIDEFNFAYWLDRDSKDGGIMLYVREDLSSNFVVSGNKTIKSLYLELNLQIIKMRINCSYSPHKPETGNHLTALNSFFLDKHFTKYRTFF